MMLEFANAMHDAGHAVTVVYPLWPYRFHFTARERRQELRRELSRRPGVDWFDVRCRIARVPWIADAFLPRADVIVATSWPVAHDVARLGPSRGRKVHVVMHHESGTGPEERIRATYRLPFHRLAVSNAVREEMEAHFACPIDAVVPAGIDPRRFFPDGRPDAASVLMLYHNDPRKGADDGLAALALVRAQHPDLKVRMCGTVRRAHMPPWVEFTFHPRDAILRRLYASSTVFLYSSRYEGFGIPPLEAMACGCPVVTTSVGAVPEFAIDNENAIVVAPGDVPGMAAGIHRVLSDGSTRRRLSLCGVETARRYALDKVVSRFAVSLHRLTFADEARRLVH